MNKISYMEDVSDEEYEKLKRSARLKFVWTAQIIIINYKTCIQNNWIKYYYNFYFNKCKKQAIIPGNMEDFEKDLDLLIEKYCWYLIKGNNTVENIRDIEAINFAYEELIENAREIWSNTKLI